MLHNVQPLSQHLSFVVWDVRKVVPVRVILRKRTRTYVVRLRLTLMCGGVMSTSYFGYQLANYVV